MYYKQSLSFYWFITSKIYDFLVTRYGWYDQIPQIREHILIIHNNNVRGLFLASTRRQSMIHESYFAFMSWTRTFYIIRWPCNSACWQNGAHLSMFYVPCLCLHDTSWECNAFPIIDVTPSTCIMCAQDIQSKPYSFWTRAKYLWKNTLNPYELTPLYHLSRQTTICDTWPPSATM